MPNKLKIYTILTVLMGLGTWGHAMAGCADITPISSVITLGGGQSSTTNNTMYTVFTGRITSTEGLTSRGKNTVKICEGTSVEYRVVSTTSQASCGSQSSFGRLTSRDKLSCNNGKDSDSFRIVGVR